MARSLLTRLLREEDGFTLTEQLVVASGMAVILAAILGLSEVAIKQAPADRERVHAVRDAEVALSKMTRELRTAHEVVSVEPLKMSVRIYRSGATITVTYDCSDPPVDGLRKCVRKQTGAGPSSTGTAIERVANPAGRPVFSPTWRNDDDGVPQVTYVRTAIEVAARGELKAGADARTVLDDGFYLRNIADGLH